MRTAARVDANQPRVVEVLRGVGASVEPTHMMGRGFPDLVVGFRGRTYLLEVKDGNKPPSKRQLTPDEQKWHDRWRGHVTVVHDEDEALAAIGAVEVNQ